jgi:hypothetical protein
MRGIGFEEVQELFYTPHYLDQLADDRSSGWQSAG